MFFQRSKFLLTLLLLVVISFGCSKKSEGLKQSDVEPLINYFLATHVSINNFTGEMSQRTMDNLISSLDPWKMYFTKSDIEQIMKDRDKSRTMYMRTVQETITSHFCSPYTEHTQQDSTSDTRCSRI